jgi:hypothetical protein
MRFAVTCLLALGLGWAVAACGQDSGSGGVASGPGAEQPMAGQAGSGSEAAPAAGSGGMAAAKPSPTASNCLDLVSAARFAEAIDPCTRAVRENPANTAVAEALRKAQAGVAASAAKANDAAAAAAAQAGAAQEQADAMKDAAGALKP